MPKANITADLLLWAVYDMLKVVILPMFKAGSVFVLSSVKISDYLN